MDREWSRRVSTAEVTYQSQDGKTKLFEVSGSRFGRTVIAKQTTCEGEEEADRCEAEGKIAQSNPHPNVVEVLECVREVSEAGKILVFVIMPKYGNNLYSDMEQRKVGKVRRYREDWLWRTVKGLVEALAILQEKGYAHRDIKPQNLLLDDFGGVKICDFGFVRRVSESDESSLTIAGTIGFFSPALRRAYINGIPETRVQHNPFKSDVFSLGVTLLVLSMLEEPSFASNMCDLQKKIDSDIESVEGYSDMWRAILRRMLVAEEDFRPDFKQLKQDIDSGAIPIQSATGLSIEYAQELPYEAPDSEASGDPLQITVRCGHQVVGVGENRRDEVPCMITLKTLSVGLNDPKCHTDVVCLIDVSGSMAGAKLQMVKNTLNKVVRVLGPSDRACIVAFNEEVSELIPLTSCDGDGKIALQQAIHSMSATGGTNMGEALKRGVWILTNRKLLTHVSTILIFSDGENNKGPDPLELGAKMVSHLHGQHGLTMHTFGYGNEIDMKLLEKLAEYGRGTFHHVKDEQQIVEAFALALGSILTTVARNITVSLKTGSGPVDCEVSRVYSKDRQDFFSLPGLTAEQTKELVFLLKPRKQRLTQELIATPVSVEVTYVDNDHCDTSRTVPMTVRFVPYERGRNPTRDAGVYANWCRVKGADALQAARAAMSCGDEERAYSALNNAIEDIRCNSPAEHSVVKHIVEDLEAAVATIAVKEEWESQGRARFASVAYSHYTQNAVSGGLKQYLTKPQAVIHGEMEGSKNR